MLLRFSKNMKSLDIQPMRLTVIGARGIRGQGLKTEKNVKVEVIMREEKIQDVVEEISRTLFANFAIVLYVSDVGILRTEKF